MAEGAALHTRTQYLRQTCRNVRYGGVNTRSMYWLQSSHRQPRCRGRTGRRICSTVLLAHRAGLGTSLLSARPIIPALSDTLMHVQSYRRRGSSYAHLDRSTRLCKATCSAGTQDTTGRCSTAVHHRGITTVETATTGRPCRRLVTARESRAGTLGLVGASSRACSESREGLQCLLRRAAARAPAAAGMNVERTPQRLIVHTRD